MNEVQETLWSRLKKPWKNDVMEKYWKSTKDDAIKNHD